MAKYRGLPIERARSSSEVKALEVLRGAGVALPRLNVDVAGEEADLSWPRELLIIEIDGSPYHQDAGEDSRKEAAWRNAGWEVRRIDSNDVYDRPSRLLALAPQSEQTSDAPRKRG
jgi:very-short-patch-repair endonuclease